MKDKTKYKLVLLGHKYPPFERREDLVNWIAEHGTLAIKRITFDCKGIKGGTGWVDEKTLFSLWQDVERKKQSKALPVE
jgi:hypothetical protein